MRDAPDEVYEGVGCTRQQSKAARNDSRGVFVNSKLRPSRTKNSENRKTISFHAREPSAMATSHMKNDFHQTYAVLQADDFIYSWDVPETRAEEKTMFPGELVRYCPKKGKKNRYIHFEGILIICYVFNR